VLQVGDRELARPVERPVDAPVRSVGVEVDHAALGHRRDHLVGGACRVIGVAVVPPGAGLGLEFLRRRDLSQQGGLAVAPDCLVVGGHAGVVLPARHYPQAPANAKPSIIAVPSACPA